MSTSRTRARILDAACRLFSARPHCSVRMADVAAAAGVTRQAVYLHFPNRSALLAAALHDADRQIRDGPQWERVSAARPGRQSLERYAGFRGARAALLGGVAQAIEAGGEHPAAGELASRDRAECEAILQGLKECGRLRRGWSVTRGADLMAVLLDTHIWVRLVVDWGWDPDDYLRQMGIVLRRVFLARRKKRAR